VSSSTSGPPTYPRGIAYIDGGRRIVTLRDAETGGGSLQIWDPKARRLVGEPVEVPAGTTGLDASPDGSRVVFGTDAGYALAWDLDPEHWSELACSIAGRSLTREEWQRYLPDRPYDPACNA
jgi:hypothetical protein